MVNAIANSRELWNLLKTKKKNCHSNVWKCGVRSATTLPIQLEKRINCCQSILNTERFCAFPFFIEFFSDAIFLCECRVCVCERICTRPIEIWTTENKSASQKRWQNWRIIRSLVLIYFPFFRVSFIFLVFFQKSKNKTKFAAKFIFPAAIFVEFFLTSIFFLAAKKNVLTAIFFSGNKIENKCEPLNYFQPVIFVIGFKTFSVMRFPWHTELRVVCDVRVCDVYIARCNSLSVLSIWKQVYGIINIWAAALCAKPNRGRILNQIFSHASRAEFTAHSKRKKKSCSSSRRKRRRRRGKKSKYEKLSGECCARLLSPRILGFILSKWNFITKCWARKQILSGWWDRRSTLVAPVTTTRLKSRMACVRHIRLRQLNILFYRCRYRGNGRRERKRFKC